MENQNNLENEVLEDVTGGVFQQTMPSTHGNICPRCRSAKHHTLRTEGMVEVRVCDQCHLEYRYRKY